MRLAEFQSKAIEGLIRIYPEQEARSIIRLPVQEQLQLPADASVTEPDCEVETDRPAYVVENTMDYPEAHFTYNADGERVFADIEYIDGHLHTQYYIGGRYEYDNPYGTATERLYLGGDAYSAPMVYQRSGNGSWTLYNIGRDYLGSITSISDEADVIIAMYRYDPWGRLVDSNGTPYAPGSEPTLFLGRGFTSHEHLTMLGLIYANARLYDPLLGRFLSPDPYVQDPDFTQNYNRYSYCLNNPLKYTDESGELFGVDDAIILTILAAAGVSMLIDYGIQIASNVLESRDHPEWTNRDIFLNQIDWFDIGVSGVIGGITGGLGVAANIGKNMGRVAIWALQHPKLITLGNIILTSAIDITGEGVQKVTFKQFGQRVVTGIITMAASDLFKSVSKTPSFFDDAYYDKSVIEKMGKGDNHAFPEIVKQFEKMGTSFEQLGDDGSVYQHLVIPGWYNGKYGQFEFIKRSDGAITHRFFNPVKK